MHRWENLRINLLFYPQDMLKTLLNNKRPTGQKHTYIRWDDGGK